MAVETAERMVIAGGSGFIGSRLSESLSSRGWSIERLVRPQSRTGAVGDGLEIPWDYERGAIDAARLEACDAVIHLGGVSIAGRFTAAHKRAVRDSRVRGTSFLATTLARLSRPPGVFVCASAVGYYGDRGDEVLTEDSPPGRGFLPEVCQEWEAACEPARAAGIRVVNLRIGLVLARDGGALRRMLVPFKLGLGGVLGNGRQYLSWISLHDLLAVFHHVLRAAELRGPVNAVAPQPATNREFTRTLGKVLRRPTLLPVPAWAIRTLLGEMGTTLLLEGALVVPARLQASGFSFATPTLKEALECELKQACR